VKSPWLVFRVAIIDRVLAAVLSVLFAPVIAVLGALVSRDGDPAPPLLRLARMGRGRVPIGVWKLRTMRSAHADGRADGPGLTRADADDRITPIGRRLRHFRLDELPQLWNVVGGSMGLLGPRPEALEYVAPDDRRWDLVLEVAPGIAGPTQLLVHDWEAAAMVGEDFAEVYRDVILPVKLAIDHWYVRNASPAIDVLVVCSLLQRFVRARPPGRLRDRIEADVPEVALVPLAPFVPPARSVRLRHRSP
jgi:lipopolysaccharide/colanic/teichoic acid biosynthesis glycosyltransferase